MTTGRRSFFNLAAFAAPCLPLAAFGLPLVITLPNYYSEVLGLSGAAVGLAFLLVRVLDIIFDPIFGTVLDRTDWKWGRFKPWMAIGVPLIMIATWMLFMADRGVGLGYLWFWLIVVYAGYSICVLSHTAWAATLSTDYHQRSRIYAFWQAGNVIGMILVLTLPVVLGALKLGGEGGVKAQGLFIVLLLPLMAALAFWRVDEPRAVVREGASKATLGDYFRLLTKPTVVRLLVVDLLMGLAPGIAGTLFFFYFMRIKAFDRTESAGLLLIYFFAAIVGGFVWTRLAKRWGKSKTLIVASLFYAVVQFGVVTLPAGNFLVAIPFLILAGLPYSAAPFLLRAMLADYGDQERLESGADRTGLLYAILTGTVKIGGALAVGTMIILAFMGFSAENPGASTELGMIGLQAFYAVAPGLLGIVAALVMIGYPLTEEKHAEILRQLGDRDAVTPPPVPEDVAGLQPNVAKPIVE
ncbi:MAG: MFS transporter [Caulobacter sp.]|nr:MFS transporter [Caulobacter sp.]